MPKHLVPQTHTNTNKKLHNLFPISVHSLLAKLNYQCSSLLHVGHRNVPNRRRHPNNLRQREQLPKTTPLARQIPLNDDFASLFWSFQETCNITDKLKVELSLGV